MPRLAPYQVQRVSYIVSLLGLGLLLISPFILPIVLASTVALALFPLQCKLEQYKWQKRHAAAFLTTVFTFVISIPFVIFVMKGTTLIIDQLQKFALGERLRDEGMQAVVNTLRQDVITNIQRFLSRVTPLEDFLTDQRLEQYLKNFNQFLLDFFQHFAVSIPTGIISLLIMIVCTFSFLKNAHGIRCFFQNIFGLSESKMNILVNMYLRDARQVYLSNIITGAVQSLIVATSIYFVVKADWFLIFFVSLILSFIPIIGPPAVAYLFALIAFFQGSTTGAIVLLVLGTFSGIIDNFLRPWLASFGESRVPQVVSFICVIGGALLLGFPGLFIGLLAGPIIYDTFPLFWEELKTPVPEKTDKA
jgi:predicted PurR-regulated permease PerM